MNIVKTCPSEIISIDENGLLRCLGTSHYSGFFFKEELIKFRDAINNTLSFYEENKIDNSYIDEVDEEVKLQEIDAWNKLRHKAKAKKEDDLYLIKNKCNNSLKIGRSINPRKRFQQLQTSTSDELELLFIVPKKGDLEEKVLNQFKHLNVKGEWFKNDGSIINFFEHNLL